MFIVHNAIRNLWRNKGRSVLIIIVATIIAAASTINLLTALLSPVALFIILFYSYCVGEHDDRRADLAGPKQDHAIRELLRAEA